MKPTDDPTTIDGGETAHPRERHASCKGNANMSLQERVLPPLPAARPEIFLRLEGVSGLEHSMFEASSGAIYARIFWCGDEVRAPPSSPPRRFSLRRRTTHQAHILSSPVPIPLRGWS